MTAEARWSLRTSRPVSRCLRRSLLIGQLHPRDRGENEESRPPVHWADERIGAEPHAAGPQPVVELDIAFFLEGVAELDARTGVDRQDPAVHDLAVPYGGEYREVLSAEFVRREPREPAEPA